MDPTVRISVFIGILKSPFYELLGILRSPGAYGLVLSHKVLLIFYWNPMVLAQLKSYGFSGLLISLVKNSKYANSHAQPNK
jgi:hypothetical protein